MDIDSKSHAGRTRLLWFRSLLSNSTAIQNRLCQNASVRRTNNDLLRCRPVTRTISRPVLSVRTLDDRSIEITFSPQGLRCDTSNIRVHGRSAGRAIMDGVLASSSIAFLFTFGIKIFFLLIEHDEATFVTRVLPFSLLFIISFEMSLQSSPKRRRKPLKSNSAARNPLSSHNLQYAVQLTKQAYEEREQTCSYQDYLALITLATFNEHEIAHIQV